MDLVSHFIMANEVVLIPGDVGVEREGDSDGILGGRHVDWILKSTSVLSASVGCQMSHGVFGG